jgi:hypothetical protein
VSLHAAVIPHIQWLREHCRCDKDRCLSHLSIDSTMLNSGSVSACHRANSGSAVVVGIH